MNLNTFPIKLEETYMLSDSVKHFRFNGKLDPAFNYIPGQFIRIHFEYEGNMLRRSYSIANPPLSDNKIEFAASYVDGGPGSKFLFDLKAGDTISASGPFGKLILKEEDAKKRHIFVATGTGVTPYRAMLPTLEQMIKNNPEFNCAILLGVRKKEDALYKDDFLSYADRLKDKMQFQVFLSQEDDSNLLAYEFKGYVQSGFSALNLNPDADIVYLCGNPVMIDESFVALQERGFATRDIIREKYISPGSSSSQK